MHDNQNSIKFAKQNGSETNLVLEILLKKIGIQPDDYELIIHKKVFTGYGIDSLFIGEVFKYLRRLRSSNIRKNVYDHIAFNELLKIKWRRFMFSQNHKLLYWFSVLLFFRPVQFFKVVKNRMSLI
jgi:hypothetical protein